MNGSGERSFRDRGLTRRRGFGSGGQHVVPAFSNAVDRALLVRKRIDASDASSGRHGA